MSDPISIHRGFSYLSAQIRQFLQERSGPAPSRFSNPVSASLTYEAPSSSVREEPPRRIHQQLCRDLSLSNILWLDMGQRVMSRPMKRNQLLPKIHSTGKHSIDFTAGGDDELNLTAGEDVEIDYEVDGWFYVKKKKPGRDGKMAGLVPVLYVSQP